MNEQLTPEQTEILLAPVEKDATLADHVGFLAHDLQCIIDKIEADNTHIPYKSQALSNLRSCQWSIASAKKKLEI